jgi:hypothetical protein
MADRAESSTGAGTMRALREVDIETEIVNDPIEETVYSIETDQD